MSLNLRFLLVLLPCDDLYLRSAATQRPTYHGAAVNPIIETELANLFKRYALLD